MSEPLSSDPHAAPIDPWRHWLFLGLSVLVLGLILGNATGNFGQEPGGESPPSAVDSDATQTPRPPEIEPDNPTPPPAEGWAIVTGLLDQGQQGLDSGFGVAVDWMAQVLFYRIGATTREVYVVDHVEAFVRPRGSDTSFRRHDPQGEFVLSNGEPATELAPRDVEFLAARGKIVRPQATDRLYHLGKIKTEDDAYEPVDYVRVIVGEKGAKYVRQAGADSNEYVKLLPPRGIPSDRPQDRLSTSEFDRFKSRGWLKTSEEQIGGVPFVVAWLALGAIFCTFYMQFFNVWGFVHAIDVVRGRYDNPDDPGVVTHFQALMSALSATVGLGNIAGVTIAMTTGGPGAFFWMLIFGAFGMSAKFVECTLGQKYRKVKEDGTVLGGPMQYLSEGLAKYNLGGLGTGLSILFAVFCILASFGGGNMFQANQSSQTVLSLVTAQSESELESIDKRIKEIGAAGVEDDEKYAEIQDLRKQRREVQESRETFTLYFKYIFGIVFAAMVGVVIIGGIRRIAATAEKIVPLMCAIYIAACLYIIAVHIAQVPALVGQIVTEAFSGSAVGGGFLGFLIVSVTGVQRAAFSNEAGIGSAAIAHSAAKTDEPVREGAVALLGPFIDTIVVCSMTALVILITGAWNNTEWVVEQGLEGAALTTRAFKEEIFFFNYVLGGATVLFAYSTIISWSYYGEQSWERLFGAGSTMIYRVLAVIAVFVGVTASLGAVLDFSDMMILAMAFPNILGIYFLAPEIKADLFEYWRRLQAEEFKTFF